MRTRSLLDYHDFWPQCQSIASQYKLVVVVVAADIDAALDNNKTPTWIACTRGLISALMRSLMKLAPSKQVQRAAHISYANDLATLRQMQLQWYSAHLHDYSIISRRR